MLNGKTVCLIIIDPQNDFINGSLPVIGADQDMKRVSIMVKKMWGEIDNIEITMDSHFKLHIAHPGSWVDKRGSHPVPFFLFKDSKVITPLTLDLINDRTFTPRNPKFEKKFKEYVQKLEANGRYKLILWPEHCIIGSLGHNIYPELLDAISEWEEKNYALALRTTKGSFPFSEHYSAVKADVPDSSDPTTMLNTAFINNLKNYDEIFIAGEALSHCVANTFRDIFEELGAEQAKKFTLLIDATSNVPGCEQMGEEFIKSYTKPPYNMKTARTTDL